MKTPIITLAACAMLATTVAPATARTVKLTVNGLISNGSDGGNDLIDVTNGPGGYTEIFAPGSVFGSIGSLTGKSIKFTAVYDTASPLLPVGTGGSFSDTAGDWAYSLHATVTIDGVTREFVHVEPVFLGLLYSAALGLTDGSPDGLSGDFNAFTYSGNVITDYSNGSFGFASTLPGSFFGTDAVLPGQLPGPGFGFAHAPAVGVGTFSLDQQTCFLTCSYKLAAADFSLTSISFGAIPEPADWALMLTGFGLIGLRTRSRRRPVAA